MRRKIQPASNKKEKHLAVISTIEFNENFLIAITKNWSKFFGSNTPKFEAIIDDNGRYTLRGPKVK